MVFKQTIYVPDFFIAYAGRDKKQRVELIEVKPENQTVKEVLQEEVLSRSGIIDGRFKGAHSGKKEKERAWEEIVAAVNA